MKLVSILAAVALLALCALTLVPSVTSAFPDFQTYLPAASVVLAALVLVAILLDRGKAEPRRAVAESAKPAAPAVVANQADAEVVTFLATLQERGRLIDFLMDDITPYSDAQVGAAARVVHEGCKAALREHFAIRPVRDENEGAGISVPAGYPADEYRLVGKISGQAPFTGTLVHRGWKTEWVKLPRVLRPSGDRLPTIAPAEVEIR
jgi:hypothetical protein